MSEKPQRKCAVCGKGTEDGVSILSCGRCKARWFCGTACQRQDWPSHKKTCIPRNVEPTGGEGKWYDRYRKCEDGTSHFGSLELITWGSRSGHLGWGNCLASESAEMRHKYEVDFQSNDSRMYRYWPQAYRWTCCGLAGDQRVGCDHHGAGPTPCQCDFCHMGRPLPDSVYDADTPERLGLNLSRGPDPRSLSPGKGAVADVARAFLGMPE
ncbi:hypothetical protein AAE478_007115 [Parahypoxylon ruwenzoriense]